MLFVCVCVECVYVRRCEGTYESGDGAERLDEDDTGGGEHAQPITHRERQQGS
jgi:hypothetical protein